MDCSISQTERKERESKGDGIIYSSTIQVLTMTTKTILRIWNQIDINDDE